MSKLRHHLHAARDEYREAAYPGDLAAEIIPPPASTFRWLLRTVAAGAVAAAVALVAVNRMTLQEHHQPFATDNTPTRHHHVAPTPVVYQLPQRMPLTLPASPFLPATPPVLVSLRPGSLEMLQQPEELLGPRLIEQLNRRIAPPQRQIEREPARQVPATQGSVGQRILSIAGSTYL